MRKVTKQALRAFLNMEDRTFNNTQILVTEDVIIMYLHGNAIAKLQADGAYVRDAGWQTPTTKERLNAVLAHFNGGSIQQRNFSWYLHQGGDLYSWDHLTKGEWLRIDSVYGDRTS